VERFILTHCFRGFSHGHLAPLFSELRWGAGGGRGGGGGGEKEPPGTRNTLEENSPVTYFFQLCPTFTISTTSQ
jgi:hypothetical protein